MRHIIAPNLFMYAAGVVYATDLNGSTQCSPVTRTHAATVATVVLLLVHLASAGLDLDSMWRTELGGKVNANLAIADLDGDGDVEMVALTRGERLVMMSGATGTVTANLSLEGSGAVAVALSAFGGEGTPEIVVGTRDGILALVSPDGTGNRTLVDMGSSYLNVTHLLPFSSGPVLPVSVDLEGDGRPELVAVYDGGLLVRIDANGSIRWAFQAGEDVLAPPAVGDVDGDGAGELVFGSMDGAVYCLDGTGSLRWRRTLSEWITGTPLMLDLDGDSLVEVIVGDQAGTVHALDGDGGVLWRTPTEGHVDHGPVALDGGERLAVVSGMVLVILDRTGEVVRSVPLGAAVLSGPVGVDVTDARGDEVLVPVLGGLSLSDNDGGHDLLDYALATAIVRADLDGDGVDELMGGLDDGTVVAWRTRSQRDPSPSASVRPVQAAPASPVAPGAAMTSSAVVALVLVVLLIALNRMSHQPR